MTRPGDIDHAVRTAYRSSLVALGAKPETMRAQAKAADGSLLLLPGEDFDGDGLTDLVGLGSVPKDEGTHTFTVAGVKGTTGEQLWSHTEDASLALPLPTRLGPGEGPGVLVVAFTETVEGSTDNETITITQHLLALSGSGSTLWERTDVGRINQAGTGAVATGVPYLTGLLHADEGDTLDVLVALEDAAVTPASATVHVTADVVSGTDGTTISEASMDDTDREPIPFVAGDLSGDRLDDYAFLSAGPQPPAAVSARGGLDGQELWSNADVPIGSFAVLIDGGDITGDGRSDPVLWSPGTLLGPQAHSSMFLLDGGDGHTVWQRRADLPFPLGNVDGLGASEVGGIVSVDTARRFGIRYVAFDAAGHAAYSRSYTVPKGGRGNNTSARTSFGPAGDVDADGIVDFQHTIVFKNMSKHRRHFNRAVVSGRTGGFIWHGTGAQPLGASVDGTGDDYARIKPRVGTSRSVAALHGNTGVPIWIAQFEVGSEPAFAYGFGVDVTDDGLAEVVVQRIFAVVGGERSYYPVVLDGQTGEVLWSG